MKSFKDRVVIGFIESVIVEGNNKKKKKLKARIDTGAEKSSMDAKLAAELQLGPIIKRKLITSAHGHTIRPVMESKIKLSKKVIKSEFTIADRSHMKYKVLVGQNILKQGFLIDPMKKVKK
jgi:hypothetical protein